MCQVGEVYARLRSAPSAGHLHLQPTQVNLSLTEWLTQLNIHWKCDSLAARSIFRRLVFFTFYLCARLFAEQLVLFSFLSTALPRDDSLQWHDEELQRLFNSDDSTHVTPGRCHFIQGGVAAGSATSRGRSAEATRLPTDCADVPDALNLPLWL